MPKVAMVEGKGKGKLKVDIRQQLSLHDRAGSLGQGMAMDSVSKMFHSVNIFGG